MPFPRLAVISEYKRLNRKIGFQSGGGSLGLRLRTEFPYLNPVPAAFRKVYCLDPPGGVESSRPAEQIQCILLVGKGSDLDPQRSHVGRPSLKADDPKFDRSCAVTGHIQGLGSCQREVENTSLGKGPPIIDPYGHFTA